MPSSTYMKNTKDIFKTERLLDPFNPSSFMYFLVSIILKPKNIQSIKDENFLF